MDFLQLLVAIERQQHFATLLCRTFSSAYIGALLHFLDIVVAVIANASQLPADNICGLEVLLSLARGDKLLNLHLSLGDTLIFLHSLQCLFVP